LILRRLRRIGYYVEVEQHTVGSLLLIAVHRWQLEYFQHLRTGLKDWM